MFVSSGHFHLPFQQSNLISISSQKLKLFHNYLFKSLVTNYINKTRIDSVIFRLLPDVYETCDFLINFPEKCHFRFFVVLTTKNASTSFFA